MSERSSLEVWWDRVTVERRNAMSKQYPLPHDGASWACMVLFFGVVGLADPTYDVKYIMHGRMVGKLLDIWPKRETWFGAETNSRHRQMASKTEAHNPRT